MTTTGGAWQVHTDVNLANKGFSHYGLYGQDGSVWAGAMVGGVTPDPDLLNVAVTVASGRSRDFYVSAPKLLGKKYFITSADDSHASGQAGPDHFIAQMTSKALILVTYSEGTLTTNNALLVVRKFQDYLAKMGY